MVPSDRAQHGGCGRLSAAGADQQRAYQQRYYDRHYPKRVSATRDQLAHPLFRSFYDRLASRVVGPGLDGNGDATSSPIRLFEPGCGEGFLAAALHREADRRGIRLHYVGADLSVGALDLARQAGATGELLLGDATDVTARLPANSQDVVVAKNLLHHLDDPAGFLDQARRVVSPGGRVVIVEPLLGCPHIWVFNVLAPKRERHYFKGQRRNVAAFRRAGLSAVRGERFTWLPWELTLYIRPSVFRRLLSTSDPRVIKRFADVDDWLTARLPWTAAYVVWTAVVPKG